MCSYSRCKRWKRVCNEEGEINMSKNELRRFEIINSKNKDKFLELISNKKLTREDLLLILNTIKRR